MSEFDKVMAEGWRASFEETGGSESMTSATILQRDTDGETLATFDHGGPTGGAYERNPTQEMRADVVVLGKQALATLIMMQEAAERGDDSEQGVEAVQSMLDLIYLQAKALRGDPQARRMLASEPEMPIDRLMKLLGSLKLGPEDTATQLDFMVEQAREKLGVPRRPR